MKRLLLVIALCCSACGSDTPTTASQVPQYAQISGSWSGTFESTTYSTVPIAVSLNQIAGAISGTWTSTGGTVIAFGNVNGTVDAGSFVGTISYNYQGGPTCSGSFSGTANASLNWTSPGFTTGNCGLSAPGNPLGVRLVLQRR